MLNHIITLIIAFTFALNGTECWHLSSAALAKVQALRPAASSKSRNEPHAMSADLQFSVTPLTRDFADRHYPELLRIHSEIPYVLLSKEHLLADEWNDRVYYGKWHHSYVAVDANGNPVGLLLSYERPANQIQGVDRNSLYLHRFAVSSDLQGNGVGLILIREAVKKLKDNGLRVLPQDYSGSPLISIQSICDSRALRFYKRLGFKEVGSTDYGYYKTTVLVSTADEVLDAIGKIMSKSSSAGLAESTAIEGYGFEQMPVAGAMGSSPVLRDVELGSAINDIGSVVGLREGLSRFAEDYPEQWSKIAPHVCDKTGSIRLRLAKGIAVSMYPHEIGDGQYEILYDETVYNNGALDSELKKNGWKNDFILHQALLLDTALRHVYMIESEKTTPKRPISIETSKIMAARAWISRAFDADRSVNKNNFLGKGKKKGLSQLLDTVCANGHPRRFERFYNMVFMPYPERRDGSGRSHADTEVIHINRGLRRLMPELKGSWCGSPEAIGLFIGANPIDGRKLAGQICAMVAKKHKDYLSNKPRSNFPEIRLSMAQELALFKALRENPDDKDVKDALYHCYALLIERDLRKAERQGLHKRFNIEVNDIKLELQLIFSMALSRYNPLYGNRFGTYLEMSISRSLFGRLKKQGFAEFADNTAGETTPIRVRAFYDNESNDGTGEMYQMPQTTEPTALDNLLFTSRPRELMRLFSALSVKERLILKLLYGIRFSGPKELPWSRNDVAALWSVTTERIRQIINKAVAILQKVSDKAEPGGTTELDDSDIYLAQETNISVESELFSFYSGRGLGWLRDNIDFLKNLYPDDNDELLDADAAVMWTKLAYDSKSTAQKQRKLADSATQKPLSERQRKRCENFRELVARYIFQEYASDKERDLIAQEIAGFGVIAMPVTGKGAKTRTLRFSVFRDSKSWRMYNRSFNEVVYVFPSIVDGNLNLRVRNTANGLNCQDLYNAYWDDKTRCPVGISDEFSGFFLDDSNTLPPPTRIMSKDVLITEGRKGQLIAFARGNSVYMLHIDSEYIYIDKDMTKPRIFWLQAFKDERGKGLMLHLAPAGPCFGRAYYENGEFVPEPGPILRSDKHFVRSTAGKNILTTEQLKGLTGTEHNEFVVRRKPWKMARRKGNTTIEYGVAPLGFVRKQRRLISVGSQGVQPYYYAKFLPQDDAVELYPDAACSLGNRLTRRFYSFDPLCLLDSKQELKKRFAMLVEGRVPNGIVVRSKFSGRIDLAPGLSVNFGSSNKMKPYFVMFNIIRTADQTELLKTISVYAFDKAPEEGGQPVALVRHFRVARTESSPRLIQGYDLKPVSLVGVERIIVQEAAYRLRYTNRPKVLTQGEESQETSDINLLMGRFNAQAGIDTAA